MSVFNEKPDTTTRYSPFVKELVSQLYAYATIRTVAAGERLEHSVNDVAMCYLILEGNVAFYSHSDNRLFFISPAPTVFGFGNVPDLLFNEYCKTLTPCLIGALTVQEARQVIEKNNLWDLLSKHMLFATNRLYTNMLYRTAPTAYEVIRNQLIELMNEDDNYRQQLTAERYIRDKTQLSRSGVMRILADLKTGGFIEMEEGKLVKINKLPAKY